MAIQNFNRAQAFGPGSDLWIIPNHESTDLLRKIDWYLNFQLSRAQNHKTQPLAPQIKSIIAENGLPEFSPLQEETFALPIMVASENGFPSKKIIEIPFPVRDNERTKPREKHKLWLKSIYRIWNDLDKPTLRVFLPSEMTPEQFRSEWPGSPQDNVIVIPT